MSWIWKRKITHSNMITYFLTTNLYDDDANNQETTNKKLHFWADWLTPKVPVHKTLCLSATCRQLICAIFPSLIWHGNSWWPQPRLPPPPPKCPPPMDVTPPPTWKCFPMLPPQKCHPHGCYSPQSVSSMLPPPKYHPPWMLPPKVLPTMDVIPPSRCTAAAKWPLWPNL